MTVLLAASAEPISGMAVSARNEVVRPEIPADLKVHTAFIAA